MTNNKKITICKLIRNLLFFYLIYILKEKKKEFKLKLMEKF